jgi:hypothetical protein
MRRPALMTAKPNDRNKQQQGISDPRRVKLERMCLIAATLLATSSPQRGMTTNNADLSRVSIRSESDREGVTRRIDWPGRIVRSERIL